MQIKPALLGFGVSLGARVIFFPGAIENPNLSRFHFRLPFPEVAPELIVSHEIEGPSF